MPVVFKLQQHIFSCFVWLNVIFELQSSHTVNGKLLPLWQPSLVISFRSQWQWFHKKFRVSIQLIQLGRMVACIACDVHKLPRAVFRMMRKGKPCIGFDDLYLAPLSALKNIRLQLRDAHLAHIFVAEEGYLRGGMKRRVLRLLWLPENMPLHTMNTE